MSAREGALNTLVFTVITREYKELGLAWGQRVLAVSSIAPRFICSDIEAYEFLIKHGFPCEIYNFEDHKVRVDEESYGEIHFLNRNAVYAVSLKLQYISEQLDNYDLIVYSDVDALWLKDPMADIREIEADFIFQPGSFPENAKNAWGFSVCTGFFAIYRNPVMTEFANSVRDSFDGDDQRTLNDVLLKKYQISWDREPTDWELCEIAGGWTKPILGLCGKTGLTAAALPHALYQRHGTHRDTCEHAIICHPNSPKTQIGKYETFLQLGIDLHKDLVEEDKSIFQKIYLKIESLWGFHRD